MPLDKLRHIAVGLLAALFGAIVWLGLALSGWAPLDGLPAAMGLAATVAGLSKEGADYLDNLLQPGMHSVDPLDFVATAAPGWLLGQAAAWVLALIGPQLLLGILLLGAAALVLAGVHWRRRRQAAVLAAKAKSNGGPGEE